MAKIKQVFAREILDAKGNPTIETTVILNDNATGTASVPCGTSVSNYEAVDVRDHDQSRFLGLGVLKAIDNVQKVIAPKLVGLDAQNQQEVDRVMIELDGTQNKSRLGGNSILSVSIAVAKAAAKSSVLPVYLYLREYIKKENLPLKIPTPVFNLINGGKHAGDNVDFQEFIIVPASFKSYSESLQIAYTVYENLRGLLRKNSMPTLVGDEGGFGPSFPTNEEALQMLAQSIELSNLRLGYDVFFGLDVAANSFYKDKGYKIKDKAMSLSASDMTALYAQLVKKYNILYLEDPLSEDDWEGWAALSKTLGPETILIGDDITSTNPYRLQMALDKKAISGIIIKPNQIGTVIEALAVVEVARAAGIKLIVSHRSGETNDDFIADFAVAVSSDYLKFGAPVRGERVAKYNRLMQIEQQLHVI
ncbi:MAG: phosphopyruvate hydratase [Candidatus Levybacteria bacterium]|nr:phosphopyruvate hydratase [Candidatus Levybacteria bacterium]